jgi:hypothetical protein
MRNSLIALFIAVKYFVKQSNGKQNETKGVAPPLSRVFSGTGWVFDFLQARPSYFDELETAGTETLINTTWQNSESSY